MSNSDESRRDALKIIGAVGWTCAFPFASNDLYGQTITAAAPPQQVHQHAGPPQRPSVTAGPAKPGYFSAQDFEAISRIADLIIPDTETPGAVAAGVPLYIDAVVGGSEPLQQICRAGLALFLQASKPEAALLTAWSESSEGPGAKFFEVMKSLTADGYYTSYIGLIEELGYQGNTALAEFPISTLEEH